ncbi:MAG: hypothetical protein ABR582_10035 [Gemmatimonadaceae bacterium]
MRFMCALSLFAVIACAGSGAAVGSNNPIGTKIVAVDQDFDLAPTGTASIDGGALTLTFDKVTEDSRCPTGVECVWAGNGVVRLTVITVGAANFSVTLSTTLAPHATTAGGYRVTLVGLKPYPKQGSTIPPASYTATLRITRQ